MTALDNFFAKLPEDKKLQEKMSALNDKYRDKKLSEAEIDAIVAEQIIPAAEEAGVGFTIEEWRRACAAKTVEGLDTYNSSCLCVGLGAGSSEGQTCVCVVGGGGKKDSRGSYLVCPFVGSPNYLW